MNFIEWCIFEQKKVLKEHPEHEVVLIKSLLESPDLFLESFAQNVGGDIERAINSKMVIETIFDAETILALPEQILVAFQKEFIK